MSQLHGYEVQDMLLNSVRQSDTVFCSDWTYCLLTLYGKKKEENYILLLKK